jgi:hypothetical protein
MNVDTRLYNTIGTSGGPVRDTFEPLKFRLHVGVTEAENGWIIDTQVGGDKQIFVAPSLEQLPETLMQAIAAAKLRR